MEIDKKNFDFDEEDYEPIHRSKVPIVVKQFIALILVAGLTHLFVVRPFFLYRETPESAKQEQLESQVDAEMIITPLSIYILRDKGLVGSERDEDNVVNLVEKASNIWHQAGIELEIKGITELELNEVESRLFIRDPRLFILGASLDEDSINVILTSNLGGINGVSYGGSGSVAVADLTTVYDFRALAHEVGHALGLVHVSTLRGRLMYQGANGDQLSLDEIEQARASAEVYN